MLCIECNKREVRVQKWRLCLGCYQKNYYKARNGEKGKGALCRTTLKKYDSVAEVEFIKAFFDHKNWLYHPATFKLDTCLYAPDFYDAERNVFIEVAGTRQAYHANKEKYDLFRLKFPSIKFEIRQSDGSLLDETEGRVQWAVVSNIQEVHHG